MTEPTSTLAALLTHCQAQGVRLIPGAGEAVTIDGPADAMTPDLIDRLKAHKHELLAVLRRGQPAHTVGPTDAEPLWRAVLDRLADLRTGEDRWLDDPGEPLGPDGWPVGSIMPPDPCPACGSLELCESAGGDLFGLTPRPVALSAVRSANQGAAATGPGGTVENGPPGSAARHAKGR
jgi:hypothetical protein